jgi:hypothetical protein
LQVPLGRAVGEIKILLQPTPPLLSESQQKGRPKPPSC